jgi:T4 RnlA family RNA ligase
MNDNIKEENMLQVQKYLHSGKTLQNLKEELGIVIGEYQVDEKSSLICLNYDQIDSPWTHPIVMECRGLILEKKSWEVVAYPFHRFYNYEEVFQITGTFDYTKAYGLQKLDGSLVSVFNYKNKWLMSTRGVIENENTVMTMSLRSNIRFRDLFDQAVEKHDRFWERLDKIYTYCFELTAPENRIVTVYKESDIHLLMMREVATLKELTGKDLLVQAAAIGVSLPNVAAFSSKEELIGLVKSLPTLEEGFVAVNDSNYDEDGISFKRVKVKNSSFVAISHIKDRHGRSTRSFVSLVFDGDVSEFLSYYPEYTQFIVDIRDKYDAYVRQINLDVSNAVDLFTKDKKTFAIGIQSCKNKGFMFKLYDHSMSSLKDYFSSIEKTKSRKHLEKYLVELLRLKDDDDD